ncbi:MAG TPA: DEAD/DEAH box helicase [Candidatus Xenobia bacterium]|nr:DEAD/DEAH box helicase [Candidatus Xenobia bacterium]
MATREQFHELQVEAGVEAALEGLREKAASTGAIVAERYFPAREARTVAFPERVDARLAEVYRRKGIERLYTHQARAAELVREGKNIVVVTPTASGKTLCYNLPVLSQILGDGSTRALYLFPTKALAQDQLAELYSLIERLDDGIGVNTYDGDTPADQRKATRAQAHIVLSNPDMLHTGILPHHTRWQRLFENLRFVVLDELHTYRGVFGSHTANVLRRLRRLCRFYGSSPQFICSSATIANPQELAEKLLEAPVELIDESGAPSGAKHFLFYNPPVVNRFLGIRRSYVNESARLATHFLERDCQTIVFANSRLVTELLVSELKQKEEVAPGTASEIRGYRGGYLPGERREIERGLRDGGIRGVVSTNALELGIDVGSLDVAVLAGYPGTLASVWQRAGRAGRRSGASAAVLVASSAPLDQFIVQNPDYFFARSPEHAFINPDNLEILVSHLKCAAFELPLDAEERFGAAELGTICEFLAERGFLHRASDGLWHWTHEAYPADTVSLRSVSSDNFVVVDTTDEPRVIAEVDFSSALTTLHEKAIYLHEARQYQVERLDYEGRKAYVKQVEADYFTDAISYTKVRVLERLGATPLPARGCARCHGEVDIRTQVVGFKKIKFHTFENVGAGKLELPEQELHTTSYWVTLGREFLESLPYASDDRQNGLRALKNALRTIATLLLMCDPRDLRAALGENHPDGEPKAAGAEKFFEPNLYLYDNYPGGIGFSQPLDELHEELLEKTLALIRGCACAAGCPSCVGPAGEVGARGKEVAAEILARLVGQ